MATLIVVTGRTIASRSRWITAWLREKPTERNSAKSVTDVNNLLIDGKDVVIEISATDDVKVVDVA